MHSIDEKRVFLKNDDWDLWGVLERDQALGIPAPPMQKAPPPGAPIIELTPPEEMSVGSMPLIEAIAKRRTQREFSFQPLTMEELSYLLWATQGVQEINEANASSRRSVPSAGARQPFETYLIIRNVIGLQPGLYHYLAVGHQLCLLRPMTEFSMEEELLLFEDDAVLFIWTAVPYRTEWRYGILSHKMIAIEAGHICQNLYLAAVSIGAGVCAIGAYTQADFDALLGIDGDEELTIYLARLGKSA